MLSDAGHVVDTIHLNNDETDHSSRVNVALKSIWSSSSYRLVDQKLRARQYQVLHVQNFFPLLSPSVYSAARKHRVPVVQTLRNYRLLCPSGIFFRDGHICEECLTKTVKYPGIVHACYRGSTLGSMSVAAMTAIHSIRGTWRNDVDLYISLTEFARQKFVREGFSAEKILVKGNFVFPDPGMGSGDQGFMIFVGRLTPEKGVRTLLSAWEKLPRPGKLKIVGEGPLAEEVQAFCEHNATVEWLGPKNSVETKELMGAASTLIFPSEWYETFGRVAIESFAKGTPVIASNLGAMSEVMTSSKAGWLFNPGDADHLAEKMQWCIDNPADVHDSRAVARQEYLSRFTEKTNCRELIAAYEMAHVNSLSRQ